VGILVHQVPVDLTGLCTSDGRRQSIGVAHSWLIDNCLEYLAGTSAGNSDPSWGLTSLETCVCENYDGQGQPGWPSPHGRALCAASSQYWESGRLGDWHTDDYLSITCIFWN
jgi:hypothetical protein